MARRHSIILPVHNGGEYVKKCVNSILLQTVKNFDLIVLENSSTDSTMEWIQSLNDDRITIYPSTKLLPIEENWGRIKDIPKGEFITLIGHDDMLLPHYLEEMDTLIQKHPDASLYQSHFSYINHLGEVTGHCLPMDEIQYGHELLAFLMKRTIHSTSYLARSKDYDRLGGIPPYPNLILGDDELWIRLALISYKATTLQDCLYSRYHNDNISRNTKPDIYCKAFKQYVDFLYKLQKENSSVQVVIDRYGQEMLLSHCDFLSLLLLRYSYKKERTQKVSELIDQFCEYAKLLIPSQEFQPLKDKKIKMYKKIDSSRLGRALYGLYRKIRYKGKKAL